MLTCSTPTISAISLRPSTYLSRLGKKCQMPTDPPVSAIARAWSGLICRPLSGVGPIARDPSTAVCDNSSGLVVADVVRRVVHELHVPDAVPVRFLQPFKLLFKEVEPLHIGDDCRLSRLVRRFQIGGAQRAADAMMGDQ